MTDNVLIPESTNESSEAEFRIEMYGDVEMHTPIIYAEDGSVDEEAMSKAIEVAKKNIDLMNVIINRQLNANTEITDGNQS